ncbi:hypothetical protein WP2W18E01_15070 [Aeromonas caviae]|uniref:YagK/YfjJ C-terminal domain-containing protein n=1 Tax=Aeromonas caviae TaxID=648 RepID=A0A6S4TLC2_AERCA|nr:MULTISPECIES: inovirus Gp2 family protein [Aeromonas]MDH0318358.1 inovirus Gp2 family protein [Aeromonas caviae]BBQ29925.1 hypothetical protein WP2W18E01_15070 [Aeromonas caviae]
MPLTLDEYMLRAKGFYKKADYKFNRDNMEKILSVSNNAMECHSRVLAFRVDLHFPKMAFWAMLFAERPDYGGVAIKVFVEELNKLIGKDIVNRRLNGKRVHPTTIRYIWAREQTADAAHPHFHMMIFLNRDTYFKLGRFDSSEMNLANKVRMAWFRVLLDEDVTPSFCIEKGLVHFPKNPEYHFGRGDEEQFYMMLMRAAYLAKQDTKRRGEGYRCFDGSNN